MRQDPTRQPQVSCDLQMSHSRKDIAGLSRSCDVAVTLQPGPRGQEGDLDGNSQRH
jgi:hypothetical protein